MCTYRLAKNEKLASVEKLSLNKLFTQLTRQVLGILLTCYRLQLAHRCDYAIYHKVYTAG